MVSWLGGSLGYILKVSKNLKTVSRQDGQKHVGRARVALHYKTTWPSSRSPRASIAPNRTCRVTTGQLLAMPIPTTLVG